MPGFDYLFEAFTLLLGLAVAEALGGLARLIKWRARVGVRGAASRIGWLLPLQAIVVVLHQTSFWVSMFDMRATLPFHYLSLVGVLTVVGAYYLLSTLLFPDEFDDWPDLDDYYHAHRRLVWFGVLAIALVTAFAEGFYSPDLSQAAIDAAPVAWNVALSAELIGTVALLAIPFVRAARPAIALMLVMIVHFILLAVLSPVTG